MRKRTILVLLVCLLVIPSFLIVDPALSSTLQEADSAVKAGRYHKAFKIYKALAKKGNAEAQNNLGWTYYSANSRGLQEGGG